MKHLHKFASVLLALVMALSLMVPAFAANTKPVTGDPSITIENATVGHTYKAYQIFSGTLSATAQTEGDLTNPTLSDIKWGAGVNGTVALNIANQVFEKTGEDVFTTPTQVAEALQKGGQAKAAEFAQAIVNGNALTTETAKAENVTTAIVKIDVSKELTVGEDKIPGTGYYLITDTAPDDAEGVKADVSLYMLQVVGPTTVKSKVGTPTPDKNVKDINDSTDTTNGDWEKTADHDIGDIMEYQLKATLPNNYSNFDKYNLVFTDTMGQGLTLVTKNSQPGEKADGSGYNYTVVSPATTNFNDVITVKVDDKEITSGYSVKFTQTTDNNGKVTESVLEITFDDVKAADVGATNGSVITIDYKALLNENAQFKNANDLVLTYPRNPNVDGDGEQTPGTTPPVTVVVFTFKTIIDKVQPNPDAIDTENPYVALAGAEFKLEKKVGNDWVKIRDAEITGEANSTFTFNGLDDGLYRLRETKTPTGFNSIPDVYFKIEALHSGDGTSEDAATVTELKVTQVKEDGTPLAEGDTITLTFTANKEDGSAATDVVNRSGAQLPETGGIGTTIFYVVGGLLTVGAVVLLVTKKRMSVDSDK